MSADPTDPSSKVDTERRRVPLERKISLKFKEFRGFITEYSSNLSMGGMFIRTTSPKPVGTIFDFELSLTDDFKLVQGIGEVIWVRAEDDGPERPSGMGVRFLDLSNESRRLIQRIVEEQVAHGGTPFELEPPGFPPPPLRQSPPGGTGRGAAPQSTLFHPTAAPVGPSPPLPPRPAPAPPRPPVAAPPSPPPAPAPAAAATPPPARVESDSFPALDPPDLPVPELVSEQEDLLPDLSESWEGEALEGFDLVDGDAAPAQVPTVLAEAPQEGDALDPLGDSDEDPTLLGGSPPAPPAAIPAPAPWAVEPPAGPAAAAATAASPGGWPRGRGLPSGFDEVARAFSPPSRPDELQGETVRLTPLEVPPEPSRPQAPIPPAAAEAASKPVAATAPALASPPRPPARRRRAAFPVVTVLVLALLGGLGVAYLRFPEVLPEWIRGPLPPEAAGPGAPGAARSSGVGPGSGAPASDAAIGAVPPVAVAIAEPTGSAVASLPAATTAAAPTAAAAAEPTATHPAAPLEPIAPGPAAARAAAGGASTAEAAAGAGAPRGRFTGVEEIWGQRSALGTVITIVTNGTVPADAFSHFRLEGANPREVIRLRGVDDRYRRTSVPVSTAEVKQVRLGYHARPDGNELHVVVDLASPRVKLIRSTAVDNRLELLLAAQ